MSQVVLHVLRPFSSEEEYLAAEAWTIDARSMLLVGQAALPADTAIVFEVVLSSGAKVIRAEGRSVGYLEASDERPGGVRVKFRRFGAQTKAFIDRALLAREAQLSERLSSAPPPNPPEAEARAPEPVLASPALAAEPSSAELPREPLERSGIHRRPAAPVAAPSNRDALLTRLRERSSQSASAQSSPQQAEPSRVSERA